MGPLGVVALQIATIPQNIRLLFKKPSKTLNRVLALDQERFPGLSGWTPTQTKTKAKRNLGLLLLSRYDGDLENWVVELIDLNQRNVLHRWMNNSDDLFYGKPTIFDPVDPDKRSLMYPLLRRDGSLIGNDRNRVARAVDPCGNLVWNTELVKRPIPPHGEEKSLFHHSIESDAEGYLWIPSNIYPQTLPGAGKNFNDDAITMLSSDGQVVLRRSVAQILIDNGYRHLIYGGGWFSPDPIHLNDIQPVNDDGPFWKKNDLFLSLRHQSMIMLYRPSTNKIIWSRQGPWSYQHDVGILNDHQISVFDNNVNSIESPFKGERVVGHNQVMIYDFETNEITSPYKAALAMNAVRTPTQGLATIYPNGDVFIEETDYGRLLRVTPEGEIVWQYVNRATDGHLYYIGLSRIIQAEYRNEFTDFLKSLNCEIQQ